MRIQLVVKHYLFEGAKAAICALALALCVALAAGAALGDSRDESSTRFRELQVGPKPDWSWLSRLRILTETDYPPFNYLDEDGQLVGFNVDLARAICRELNLPCEINTADWANLVPSLKSNEADAVFASMSITPKALNEVDFTNRYYTTPAKFVGKTSRKFPSLAPRDLQGVKVAVVKGSAHEAFLRDFFEGVRIVPFANDKQARDALKAGDVELLFGDGIGLMFWIQGTDAARCCEFKGQGYVEARYFGDGVGIAVKHGNSRLREVLDYALARVKASGRYEELLLRYFPLPLY